MWKIAILGVFIIVLGFGCTPAPADESAAQPGDETVKESGEAAVAQPSQSVPAEAPPATKEVGTNRLIGTWLVDVEKAITDDPELGESDRDYVENLVKDAKLVFTEDVFTKVGVVAGDSGVSSYTIVSDEGQNMRIRVSYGGGTMDLPIVFSDENHLIFLKSKDPFTWVRQ